MTHYFGLIYSGVILGGVLLTCFFRRRSPLRAGLSIVAGWLVFLPWIPVFLRHLRMGRPTFWIPVPKVVDLRNYFGHYLTDNFSLLAAILCVLAVTAVVFAAARGPGHRMTLSRLLAVRRRETPLLVLAFLFGLVPLMIYFISTRSGGTSSFLERYMLPGAIGWAIVCAHFANRVFRLCSLIARRGAGPGRSPSGSHHPFRWLVRLGFAGSRAYYEGAKSTGQTSGGLAPLRTDRDRTRSRFHGIALLFAGAPALPVSCRSRGGHQGEGGRPGKSSDNGGLKAAISGSI
jgi:hypothetical protein